MNDHLQGSPRPLWVSTLFLVSLLTLLAFGLRLFSLDAYSFWTDEGLTPLRSSYSLGEILSNRIIIQDAVTKDTHPPFYYLLIHFSRQAWGESDFAYRYPSLLAGVLLVPLLFQFGRSLFDWRAGIFAGLLAAINPLQVYYGNEARMYTLLVLLMAAASYVLWRATTGADLKRSLILYTILSGLAIYTHYTSIFLIALQTLFWVWLLWQAGYKRFIVIGGIVAFLLAIPVIPFTIPRLFTGAEANYYYVPPLVMLQDVYRFFGFGLTVDFNYWVIKLLGLGVVILLIVGIWAAKPWEKRSFLLVYLFAVVIGLMAGSLIKPMYQGARHIMIGSPAFILLLALGAAYLLKPRESTRNIRRVIRNSAAWLLILTPFAGSILSLYNLNTNPDYAKDDFRSMIRYIEERAGENDTVLYNNAILLPLHDHYQTRPDLPANALPVYPYPADGMDSQLEQLAGQYDRIWFVSDPPADGRDDEHRVLSWLRENLDEVDRRAFHARTTIVDTTAYRAAPSSAQDFPEEARPLDILWPDLPALQGIQLNFTQPAPLNTLWFDLLWQGDSTPPDVDTTLRFVLIGPDGAEWLRDEQSLARPTAPWLPSTIIRQSYKITLPTGMPPGSYQLLAEPLNKEGASIGEPKPLVDFELGVKTQPSSSPEILFANGLSLQEIALFDLNVRPGHTLPLSLIWRGTSDGPLKMEGIRYTLEVVGSDGQVLRTQGGQPGADWLDLWPPGSLIRENSGLYFPPETPVGRYRLRWQLMAGDKVIPGRPPWRPWSSAALFAGSVEVIPWPVNRDVPTGVTKVEADFGPAIELYGYDLPPLEEGGQRFTLYWLAKDVPQAGYLIFIHLVNREDGEIMSQIDRFPADGLRPTQGWRQGEVINDEYWLSLPPDIAPGIYDLNVGIYNPDDGQRLPVTLNGNNLDNNQLTIDSINIP